MSENVYCVRKCNIEDIEVLVKLRLEFLKEAGLAKDGEDLSGLYKEIKEAMESRIDKDLHLWIAEVENIAVATGGVCIWDKLPLHVGKSNSSKVGYVLNMFTKQEYRKKGIASDILKSIISFLKDEGIPKAMLHALEDGKEIYKGFGFSSKDNLMEMKILGG